MAAATTTVSAGSCRPAVNRQQDVLYNAWKIKAAHTHTHIRPAHTHTHRFFYPFCVCHLRKRNLIVPLINSAYPKPRTEICDFRQ